MRTLQQIKDYIATVQNDLAIFERKRALLRRAHVALYTSVWVDGMEIDHDSVPTEIFPKEIIDNEIKATVIAQELTHRAVCAMETLQGIIPDDYEGMFADMADEIKDSKDYVLKILKKVRNLLSVGGGECSLWADFADEEKNILQKLLTKADDAIAQDDVYGLRNALQSIFQQQAPLIKKQIEERLPPLKNEYEELRKDLQSASSDEIAKKCGKPYWVEVSGTEEWFVKNQAFPILNSCASEFISQPITEFDIEMFHYKRIYDDPEMPSAMRIFGFNSKEEFEKLLAKYNAQSKEEYITYWANQSESIFEHNDETWAKSAVLEIDDSFYYFGVNELFPQWKEILTQAQPILENAPNEKWCHERCKELLQLPVVELKLAPHKESA